MLQISTQTPNILHIYWVLNAHYQYKTQTIKENMILQSNNGETFVFQLLKDLRLRNYKIEERKHPPTPSFG